MGSQYALIINGDTNPQSLGNVDRSASVLEEKGYETFVASPGKPSAPVDHYTPATPENIEKLIADLNHAVTGRRFPMQPRHVSSEGYVQEGKTPFEEDLFLEAKTDEELQRALGRLQAGQYAVVFFSNGLTKADQEYRLEWRRFVVKGNKGQHLCLLVSDSGLAKEYGAVRDHSIMVFEAGGRRRFVAYEQEGVFKALTSMAWAPEEMFAERLAVVRQDRFADRASLALREIILDVVEEDLSPEAKRVLFQDVLEVTRGIESYESIDALSGIASLMAEGGFVEEAKAVFEEALRAVVISEGLDDFERALSLERVVRILRASHLPREARVGLLFGRVLGVTRTIESRFGRRARGLGAVIAAAESMGLSKEVIFRRLLGAARMVPESYYRRHDLKGVTAAIVKSNLSREIKADLLWAALEAADTIPDEAMRKATLKDIEADRKRAGLF